MSCRDEISERRQVEVSVTERKEQLCVRNAAKGANLVASTKNSGQSPHYPLFFYYVFCQKTKGFQRFLSFAKTQAIFTQKICIRQSFAKLILYRNILCLLFLQFILKAISSTNIHKGNTYNDALPFYNLYSHQRWIRSPSPFSKPLIFKELRDAPHKRSKATFHHYSKP